jgi:hypothetical protein
MATESVKVPLLAGSIDPDEPTPAVRGHWLLPASSATVSKAA